MIQMQSQLNVADNSGAKRVQLVARTVAMHALVISSKLP